MTPTIITSSAFPTT